MTNEDVRNLFADARTTTPNGFQKLVRGIKKHHPDHALVFAKVAEDLVICRRNPNFADKAALQFVKDTIPLK